MKNLNFKKFFSQALAVVAPLIVFQGTAQAQVSKLHPDDVAGFEVVIAGKCASSYVCALGHSFLRVVSKNATPDDDLMLGFTTPNPEAGKSAFSHTARLLLGSPLDYSVMRMRGVWEDYAVREKREMIRVPLQITEEVRLNLISNINQLFLASDTRRQDPKGYNLLVKNCAGKIVALLNDSGTSREMVGVAVPTQLPDYLYRTYIGNYPPLRIPEASNLERQMQRLPEDIYRFCADAPCARRVVSQYKTIWPQERLEFPNFQRTSPDEVDMNSKPRSEPAHWNRLKPVVQKHYQLLLNETLNPTTN